MVCWLVCAGEVLEYASFWILFSVSAAWLDWLACDCVQLLSPSCFCPVGCGGGSDFFFVVIFGCQHEPAFCVVCGGLFFVRFGLFTALVLGCFCSEIFLWRV